MLIEAMGAAAVGACAYGMLYEAYRVRLTELVFTYDDLPPEFDGFSILQLGDLHLKKENRLQKLCISKLERKILNCISGRQVDLIAITGDAELRGEQGFQAMRGLLDSVQARHGAIFIPGNGEYQDYDIDTLLATLDSWGVKTLRNGFCAIERDGAAISVIGVDDPFTRHSDVEAAMAGAPAGGFKIMLAHSPSIAREAIKHRVQLVISGHTHGGQIRLPFVGALYTHLGKGSPELDIGLYEGRRLAGRTGLDPGNTKVFVTRGVGLSEFYIRFLCPPEIALITLRRRGTRDEG
ncbi:MAG: metallophosphoesterase [Armatimonadota bacterium]|nr:metallophosphoesterase [Armatimonadota bacterium]